MPGKPARRYLFIGGPPRSGTTAFVRLMNKHPGIFLGSERYKFVYGKKQEDVGPHLFEAERFLQPTPDETNISQRQFKDPERAKARLDRAIYLGDKVPRIMRYQRILNERFPSSRFIIMYRDVHRVCSSWNRRAEDVNDNWPATNNFKVAVEAINSELRAAVAFCKDEPARCLIVRYENLFGPNGINALEKILDWLKIRHHPRIMDAIDANQSTATQIQSKELLELEGQREFIADHIDWGIIRQAEALAV